MTSILENIRYCTYCVCYKCTSVHEMQYIGDNEYMCEECYRTVNINSPKFEKEEFDIDWKKLKKYILNSSTPRKVIKMFIVKILKREFIEYQIDAILEELKTTGTFNFKYLEMI